MSIIHLNGWDYFPSNLALNDTSLIGFMQADGFYSFGGQGFNTQPGVFGGTALHLYSNSEASQALASSYSNGAILGTRFKLDPNISFTDPAYIALKDSISGNNVVQVGVVPTSGQVTAIVNGITYSSAAAKVLINTAVYLQFKWLDNFFEVRVNGDIVIQSSVTGIDLASYDSLHYRTGNYGGVSNGAAFDDLYLLDPSTGDNVDYLGNVRVGANLASGNGDVIDLTPIGAATNWQAALNWQLSNTVYNETATVGNYDLYQYAAGAATRNVFGIQVKGAYTQDNGVQLWGKNQIKTGGTVYGGTEKGLNSMNYGTITDYWDKNPNTGAFFTDADLAALQAGPLLSRSD